MTKRLLPILLVSACLAAPFGASASQLPPPSVAAPDSGITQVYGGCGPYGHRGPGGYCRPGGQGGGYVRGRACPRGWHLGPRGGACVRNW